MTQWFALSLTALICISAAQVDTAHAQVDTQNFHSALKLKKGVYRSTGVITGGHRDSSDFRIQTIRIAENPEGYTRIVMELYGNRDGEKSTLQYPPYFQVQILSDLNQARITLYGKPKLEFSTTAAMQSSKKTKAIKNIEFLPLVENDRWTWTINTKSKIQAEVFELSSPARIIVDLK